MSSISSLSSTIQQSPKQRILDSISSSVSAGSISKTDQTALTSAVDDIDTALQGSSKSSSSGTFDPSQIKTKIDSLIDNEVSSGKLTSDQASTLKDVFSKSGGQHAHGAKGASDLLSSSSTDDSTSSSTTTSSSSSTSDVSDLLANFLKDLQSSQTSSSGYSATGSTGSSNTSNSLLFSFSA